MTTRVKPLIVITMGDAAGIGPEIIVRTLDLEEIYRICHPLVVGEGTTMHKTIEPTCPTFADYIHASSTRIRVSCSGALCPPKPAAHSSI